MQRKLAESGAAESSWARLVLAACAGEAQLDAALSNGATAPQVAAAAEGRPGAVYLRALAVEGFRGIGPQQVLEVQPGPGLTVISGRNGSGKSSFAEAAELLITGENRRWSEKSLVWKEGWRNLHYPERTAIRGDFAIEDAPGGTVVTREWPAGSDLDDGVATFQQHGRAKQSLAAAGWRRPLELYRPFLSYNELSAMFNEGPTAMYDHLSEMLGLEDLAAGGKALQAQRLRRRKALDAVKEGAATLLARLGEVNDERAAACVALLKKKAWDLDAVQAIVSAPSASDAGDGAVLRRIAALELPTADEFATACSELEESVRRARLLEKGPGAAAAQVADLLEAALRYHGTHKGDPCPVCGAGTLDDTWASRSTSSVAALRATAREVDEARRALIRADDRVKTLVAPVPTTLAAADDLAGVPELTVAWTAFARIAGLDGAALAAHVRKTSGAVRESLAVVQAAAAVRVAEREDAWRAAAIPVAAWLSEARAARGADAALKEIQEAEAWLKATGEEIRMLRFQPIAAAAVAIWQTLRLQSNVDLREVALEGSGPKRHPVLRVGVDGALADALSVMSQGELHSMALSLFIPRATMPESPFRFMVIDDPVQSMDPARVDGLARVLEQAVASGRQVLVFTHDDRLPEAVRRLGIQATFVTVTRGEGSVVTLSPGLDPVYRAIYDAKALMRTSELPAAVANQVVPGYCRVALEAACFAVVRRRRLGRGERHVDLEGALHSLTLAQTFALALFDDAERAGDVLPRLNREFGVSLADAYVGANKGTHLGQQTGLSVLVRDAEELARRIGALK